MIEKVAIIVSILALVVAIGVALKQDYNNMKRK